MVRDLACCAAAMGDSRSVLYALYITRGRAIRDPGIPPSQMDPGPNLRACVADIRDDSRGRAAAGEGMSTAGKKLYRDP